MQRNKKFKRLPKHIGIIPDGNRRWAVKNSMLKQEGYQRGLEPGLLVYEMCLELGIPELTFYGFTQDNTKRSAVERIAFQQACVDAVRLLSNRDASLLVMGDHTSHFFPPELLEYVHRRNFGNGLMHINFLVNYGWKWDLSHLAKSAGSGRIASHDISRIDLIIRWGGRSRLSGFLPLQSVYSDLYVVDDYWPDFRPEHLQRALEWYQEQDITLGG